MYWFKSSQPLTYTVRCSQHEQLNENKKVTAKTLPKSHFAFWTYWVTLYEKEIGIALFNSRKANFNCFSIFTKTVRECECYAFVCVDYTACLHVRSTYSRKERDILMRRWAERWCLICDSSSPRMLACQKYAADFEHIVLTILVYLFWHKVPMGPQTLNPGWKATVKHIFK